MKRLKNKIAFITAAGQGIGRAVASNFALEGAAVWATDINEEALLSLQYEYPQINIRKLDVTSFQAITALSNEIGAVDILFNCAGFVHNGTILECSEKDWDFSFNLNVKSMYQVIQAFLPAMLKCERGSIINMSSVASSLKGVKNRFVYGATKAAIIGMSKAIAADYVVQNIRCNAICPGTVATPSLNERVLALGGEYNAAMQNFIDRQPMGRLGRVDEVASLAVYLGSDDSSYTTGTVHIIDGGWSN